MAFLCASLFGYLLYKLDRSHSTGHYRSQECSYSTLYGLGDHFEFCKLNRVWTDSLRELPSHITRQIVIMK